MLDKDNYLTISLEPWITGLVRASRPARVITVLTAGLALALLTMFALGTHANAAGDDPLSSGTPPCKPKGHAYFIDKTGFNYTKLQFMKY